MIYLGKKLKTFVTFDFVNIRSSRRYFACRGLGTSFILKESPIGVRQTGPLFRLGIAVFLARARYMQAHFHR